MNKPVIIERLADNGEHSHWALCESETGKYLWSEAPEEEFSANRKDLADVGERVFPIIDFALRIAKALKESQSSTALFFMQQAYPDDIVGLDQPSNDEILDNIITLASQSELKPGDARNEKIELLEKYSLFLEESGYLDTDWRDEEPFAIDEFFKNNNN